MRAPRLLRRAVASTRNVLELVRAGRLGDPYGAPFEVVDRGAHHRLRQYAVDAPPDSPVALLVPPLMVTSEVYDIEPALSAVAALGRMGVQPFVVDFGAPEREEGGLARTLDDHVVATARCIRRVREATGRDVHVLGYSQGGMFAYQAAAYVRAEGVASVVTFGSPVDLHKSLPAVHKDATGALVRALDPVVAALFERIDALPGALTSIGFKLLSPRKEIEQRVDFVRNLHNRAALVRREARRRFLGGDGFVAWPAPALRAFVEQFVVHNRMLSGGMVIDGRAVSLADITCPVLCFIGAHDELARPAAVRAIAKAAPVAEVSFATLAAGHFGLVVGTTAMRETWPAVAGWIHHREGRGELPPLLRRDAPAPAARDDEPEGAGFDLDLGADLVLDALTGLGRTAWRRVGEAAQSASDAWDGVRYQEPRLRALAVMTDDTVVSASKTLAARAAESPDATCFLWRGRAFSYAVADRRVGHVVRGLWRCGVRPGDRVAVLMHSRPSLLTMLTALCRLGAVAVVAPPDAAPDALARAFAHATVSRVACDPDHAAAALACASGAVLVLGGGAGARALPDGVTDMEAIDPEAVALPDTLRLDGAKAGELALVLLRPTAAGELRAAPVTHRRVALSALGAAAACTLTPEDTVYCPVPLHHPTGVLVSVGAALAGGARLALAERFDPDGLLAEARRYGATVVFYAGEMLRPLVHAPPSPADRAHSIRLFAGSGVRADLWPRVRARFGADVMEFYASTSQRVVVANASGEKPGALGRRMPGSAEILVARADLLTGEVRLDATGRPQRADAGEAGLVLVRLDARDEPTGPVVEAPDARWHVTHDVVRADDDGDLWFVDARSNFVDVGGEAVSLRAVEDALYAVPEVTLCVAWKDDALRVAYTAREPVDPARLDEALAALPPRARPAELRRVETLALTEGFRPRPPTA